MILVIHIWISVWIIQATATALVQALRDRRLEDTTKSEFVIKISLKSSIALTLRLEPFLAGGHRASWVLGDERIWQRKVIDLRGNQRISSLRAQLFHNCCKGGRGVSSVNRFQGELIVLERKISSRTILYPTISH